MPIHKRLDIINKRKEIWHWEGELIIFTALRSKNITTMVERKTRFIKLVLNSNKTSKEVIGGIKSSFKKAFTSLKSMTFDHRAEFSNHHEL